MNKGRSIYDVMPLTLPFRTRQVFRFPKKLGRPVLGCIEADFLRVNALSNTMLRRLRRRETVAESKFLAGRNVGGSFVAMVVCASLRR